MNPFAIKPFVPRYNWVKQSLVLIDGTNMFCRACLVKYDGTDNEYGSMIINMRRMFIKALRDKPKYVAIVFDSSKDNFRHLLLPSYKSNRKTNIKNKATKLRLIKAILHYYGFTLIDSGDYEADDTIGSLANRFQDDYYISIHSEDKDFLQCVNDKVVLAKGGLVYDKRLCKAKFGIHPSQFIDYLSLMGDAVDCIPGANKWGKVSASKYLSQCGNIENIKKEVLTKSLQSIHKLDLKLTRALTTIRTDLDIIDNIEELRVGNKDEVKLRAIASKFKVTLGDFYA